MLRWRFREFSRETRIALLTRSINMLLIAALCLPMAAARAQDAPGGDPDISIEMLESRLAEAEASSDLVLDAVVHRATARG